MRRDHTKSRVTRRHVIFCAVTVIASIGPRISAAQAVASSHIPESTGKQPLYNWEPISSFKRSSEFRYAATTVGLITVEYSLGQSNPVCTGLVISPILVLTARHCYQITDETTQKTEFVIPRKTTLLLDYINVGASTPIKLKPLPVEKGDGDLDYMLLSSVDSIPLNGRRIPIAGRDPESQDDLYIIHHPFPYPLEISRQSCHATEQPIDGHYFSHVCDTNPGSSGAPVLDIQLNLVGIHLANGKSQLPGTSNRGLLLSRIIAVSPKVSEALKTFGKKDVTVAVSVPKSQALLKYTLTTGETFTKSSDGWTLTYGGTNPGKIVHLKAQDSGDAEWMVWDPAADFLYRIPKRGGAVTRQHGGDPTWQAIGGTTK
jgi:hypothetical protein